MFDALSNGSCEEVFHVKVDRIFFPEIVHYIKGGKRLKEMVSVDLVVLDCSVSIDFRFFFIFIFLFLNSAHNAVEVNVCI